MGVWYKLKAPHPLSQPKQLSSWLGLRFNIYLQKCSLLWLTVVFCFWRLKSSFWYIAAAKGYTAGSWASGFFSASTVLSGLPSRMTALMWSTAASPEDVGVTLHQNVHFSHWPNQPSVQGLNLSSHSPWTLKSCRWRVGKDLEMVAQSLEVSPVLGGNPWKNLSTDELELWDHYCLARFPHKILPFRTSSGPTSSMKLSHCSSPWGFHTLGIHTIFGAGP